MYTSIMYSTAWCCRAYLSVCTTPVKLSNQKWICNFSNFSRKKRFPFLQIPLAYVKFKKQNGSDFFVPNAKENEQKTCNGIWWNIFDFAIWQCIFMSSIKIMRNKRRQEWEARMQNWIEINRKKRKICRTIGIVKIDYVDRSMTKLCQ